MGMFCKLVGHSWPDAGRRLKHQNEPLEVLVELTADCGRCGATLHVGWYRRPPEWNTLKPVGKTISGLGMHNGRPVDMRQLRARTVHPQDQALNAAWSDTRQRPAAPATSPSNDDNDLFGATLLAGMLAGAASSPAPEICRAPAPAPEPFSSGGGGDYGGGGASGSWSSSSSSSDSGGSSSSSGSD